MVIQLPDNKTGELRLEEKSTTTKSGHQSKAILPACSTTT